MTEEGEIVVRVHAAAAEGAANRELVEVLARALAVGKSAVRIIRGEKARTKQVMVEGLEASEAVARIRGEMGEGQPRGGHR